MEPDPAPTDLPPDSSKSPTTEVPTTRRSPTLQAIHTPHGAQRPALRPLLARPRIEAKGVWAGLIALYPPGAPVCWGCVQRHLATPSLAAALPAEPKADIRNPGCLEPTYTGAGYDLAAIAAQVVRTAAGYLTASDGDQGRRGGVVTVALRDDEGRETLPRWSAHDLAPHGDCASHTTP